MSLYDPAPPTAEGPGTDTGRAGCRRLVAAFLLALSTAWPWSAPARAVPAVVTALRSADIVALSALTAARADLRSAAVGRLERRRLALDRGLAAETRRARQLALQLRSLRRTAAALADALGRVRTELRVRRQREMLRQRQRERAATALFGRLHRRQRVFAASGGRMRLLLGELLREGADPGGHSAALQERRRELVRARAAVSVALARVAASRRRSQQRIGRLRQALMRLAIYRREARSRLDAAELRHRQLRELTGLAAALAALDRVDGATFARPAAARAAPLRIARDRDLRIPVRFPGTGPARLGPRSLPPDLGPRGSLSTPMLPAAGRILSRFGDEAAGVLARGITILVDHDQPVRAVRGGRVAFAGPFREFGLVLILDHGDGYHTLLAGMTRLDVRRGDLIAAGAVVGRVERSGREDGRLYIELRLHGRPVNPLPWLAARADRTRG